MSHDTLAKVAVDNVLPSITASENQYPGQPKTLQELSTRLSTLDDKLFRKFGKDEFLQRVHLIWEGGCLLQRLKVAECERLGSMTVIKVPPADPADADVLVDAPFECHGLSPLCLFKRAWYDCLFEAMSESPTVALIGSPGTSKSTLQFWLLYEFVNRQRPWRGRRTPRVVIRHEGSVQLDSAVFYFLEEGIAVRGIVSDTVLRCFNPHSTFYMFEPRQARHEPLSRLTHGIDTIITCSPAEDRYNEFRKTAIMLYMPHYTLEELILIGNFSLAHGQLTAGFDKDLLSPDAVERRFYMYGGVIQKVLCLSVATLVQAEEDLSEAIDDAAKKSYGGELFRESDLTQRSSCIVKWTPLQKSVNVFDFRVKEVSYVNDYVYQRLVEKADGNSTERSRMYLASTFTVDPHCPQLRYSFEFYALRTYRASFPHLTVLARSRSITRCDMERNVLYYPLDDQFPAAEAYHLDNDGRTIILVQVSIMKDDKKCTSCALAHFAHFLKLPRDDEALTRPGKPDKLRVAYLRKYALSKWLIEEKQYGARCVALYHSVSMLTRLKIYFA
jgi:hypothetical protein